MAPSVVVTENIVGVPLDGQTLLAGEVVIRQCLRQRGWFNRDARSVLWAHSLVMGDLRVIVQLALRVLWMPLTSGWQSCVLLLFCGQCATGGKGVGIGLSELIFQPIALNLALSHLNQPSPG